MKILLIEDDESVRNAIQHYLERSGYEVHTMDTSVGAVEEAVRLSPDLVLTDHNLGDCETGLAIAHKLKCKNIRAILMSADSTVRGPSLDMGVPFVFKTDIYELMTMVQAHEDK